VQKNSRLFNMKLAYLAALALWQAGDVRQRQCCVVRHADVPASTVQEDLQ
jgi:hypothetical protein